MQTQRLDYQEWMSFDITREEYENMTDEEYQEWADKPMTKGAFDLWLEDLRKAFEKIEPRDSFSEPKTSLYSIFNKAIYEGTEE